MADGLQKRDKRYALVSVNAVLWLECGRMLVDYVKDVDSQLHLLHLVHECLNVLRILTDKRHQILVGDDVLQILGIPRILHVYLYTPETYVNLQFDKVW